MLASRGMVAAIAAIAIGGEGCTTLLYKGSTRPSSEVAVVMSTQTIVDRVDDVMVRDYASGTFALLEILPGPHRLGISLNRVTPGLFVTNVARSDYFMVCVVLEAGHRYRTEPLVQGYRFVPRVVDLTAARNASSCRGARKPSPPAQALPPPGQPRPIPNPSDTTGLVAAGDAAAAAGPGPAATPNASSTGDGSSPNADPATPPPPPAPRATAVDTEEPFSTTGPSISRARARERLPSDAELAKRPPGSGLSLVLGAAFGGEDFVKATDSNGNEQTLSSGSGVILGVGGMLTPLWAGEAVGFGLGLDGAIKYDHLSASNGSASITRFPLALTAHMLANVSDGVHYVIFKGGVTRDFGVNYSASGFADLNANVSGTWGPTGAFGYYKRSNDTFGWDMLAFFALTKHAIGTERINANSFGVSWGLHWRP